MTKRDRLRMSELGQDDNTDFSKNCMSQDGCRRAFPTARLNVSNLTVR